jgi:cytochrome P450
MSITDGFDLVSSHAYASKGVPHDVWTRLRAESPIHWCTPDSFAPFWAITRHADICEISKQPDTFSSASGIAMIPLAQEALVREQSLGASMRVIIEMDPPEHRSYRNVASPIFTPRAVKAMDDVIRISARTIVDRLAGATGEGECDFATDVAAAHPLRILSTMLGVPRESEPDILRLTNELFASDDPDLQRKGEDRRQALIALGLEFLQLFSGIIQDRRANPRHDLASLLANGQIDGQPMGMMETLGYYLITFSAGHDTTMNALVGGMRAFLENPEQFERLRRHPELVDSAVEEVVRWTSPVNHMKRRVTRDYELRGQKLRAGDWLVMFYASANRDEEVFEAPFEFRIDRSPNPHLAFGIGEHFCLGANLARRSQRALFRELAQRMEWAELAGEPEQIHSAFVVGLKKLPMRYRIRRPSGSSTRA